MTKKNSLKRDQKLQTSGADTQFITLHHSIFEGLPGLTTQRPPFRAVITHTASLCTRADTMGSNGLCTLVTCDNHHCSCGSPAFSGTRRWAFNFSAWFADRNRKLLGGWIRQWQHDSCSFPPLNRFLSRSVAAIIRISMTRRAVPVWNQRVITIPVDLHGMWLSMRGSDDLFCCNIHDFMEFRCELCRQYSVTHLTECRCLKMMTCVA